MADFLKIDLHTHILPERWPDLRERYGYGGWVRLEHKFGTPKSGTPKSGTPALRAGSDSVAGSESHSATHGSESRATCCAQMWIDDQFFREVHSNSWDPRKRIGECDACGVNVQVLSTVPVMFGYWAKPADAHDLSQLLNDHLAGVIADYPDRFLGLGTVPLQDSKLAIKELERCVNELHLPGVQIGSHVNGSNLNDERIVEVLEAAQDLDAAVFVHPWEMLGKDRMSQYWLSWLVGMPAETALAICSMIFGGVFEKLPKLRVGFAHGGGAFPGTIGRIEHGFKVRPDLCAIETCVNPRGTLGRMYFDSLVHDADALRYLIKLVGEHRIALGSDYPFPLGEHRPGELIESMDDLSQKTKQRLLAGTALEFLNVSEEDVRGRSGLDSRVAEARG